MRLFSLALFAWLAACSLDEAPVAATLSSGEADPIDYDALIGLDAESLAEGGMVDGYAAIQAAIAHECVQWLAITQADEGTAQYNIRIGGKVHFVYGSPPTGDAWAMASATLLDVVNRQLEDCPFKVYALMGGNDLHAIPLTDEEFEKAQKYHENRYDRPYTPTYDPPDYGYPQ